MRLTGENNGDNIARYLMRFVFFNDDFQIQDISARDGSFRHLRPASCAHIWARRWVFRRWTIPCTIGVKRKSGGRPPYLHRTDPINGDGFFIMCEAADKDALWQFLDQTSLVAADEPAFDFYGSKRGSLVSAVK